MQPLNRTMCVAQAALLALAAAITPSGLSGQERGPVASGVLQPLGRAPVTAPSGAISRREISLMTPEGKLGYQAAKARARTASRPAADQMVSSSVSPSAADITASFAGLNRLTAQNNGFIFVPPDPQIAAAISRLVEVSNSAIRLYTKTGGVLQTMDLNTFFGTAPGGGGTGLLFDPKIVYDRNATNRRVYVVALQQMNSPQLSRIWIGISRSADPTTLAAAGWCRYFLNGIRNAGTANASWADYPGLATAADQLVITVNQFRFSDRSFTFAIIHTLRKLVAANNAASCPAIPFFTFQPSTIQGDINTFTLQPVQQLTSPSSFPGTTNPSYTINTHRPSTAGGTTPNYRIFRVRNVGGSPSIQTTNVAGNFAHSIPPDAPQTGSSVLLSTGDNRVTEAAGLGNNLWGTHATGCVIGGSPGVRSCARTIRVTVGQAAGGTPTATITQQRAFGVANSYLFWPGIAVNLIETVVVNFHYVNPSTTGGRLSHWWTIKDIANIAYGTISPIANGTCAYTTTNRTGDYAGAETDPTDGKSFWLNSEIATTFSGLSGCNWQNRIARILPGDQVAEGTPGADR
jgi:hypothetical protein